MKPIKHILTLTIQPLGTNYGGTMQAYALQKALKKIGYNVTTHDTKKHYLAVRVFAKYVKYYAQTIILRRNGSSNGLYIPDDILALETKGFVRDKIITANIPFTKRRRMPSFLAQFTAIVVGSDQVWRKDYVDIERYLLDFVSGVDTKKISYAASFGKDDISDYGHNLTEKSKKLAQQFDAISVRESSAANICKEYWGVDAVQVLDPTMLLSKEDYIKLIENNTANITNRSNYIFSYILDDNTLTVEATNKVERQMGLKTRNIKPLLPKSVWQLLKNPARYAWPGVPQWLLGFYNADFVVTDSFHGCAFSIIFNKPFIALGNKERGLTRFTSLLQTFGLEDRLVLSSKEITEKLINKTIDWAKINQAIEHEQKQSFKYLKESL